MIINQANLDDLFRGYRTTYQNAFAAQTPMWGEIATEVPSTTSENTYSWLGAWPRMREWIGSRVYNNLATHRYSITNRKFESTVDVPRDKIEDDQYGVYTPLFKEMGQAAALHPDELTFELLGNAFDTECFDGQAFFDTDHPVTDPETKKDVSVSNMQAGAGAPWFLMDTSRALKPIIYQPRRRYDFVRKDDPTKSDRVFDLDSYAYGVDGRGNVGFGFWQMAYGSKAELTKVNFRAARNAMTGLKNEAGRPLGIKPTIIVVGNSNADKARDLILAERLENGQTNTDRNLVKIFECPWLD